MFRPTTAEGANSQISRCHASSSWHERAADAESTGWSLLIQCWAAIYTDPVNIHCWTAHCPERYPGTPVSILPSKLSAAHSHPTTTHISLHTAACSTPTTLLHLKLYQAYVAARSFSITSGAWFSGLRSSALQEHSRSSRDSSTADVNQTITQHT